MQILTKPNLELHGSPRVSVIQEAEECQNRAEHRRAAELFEQVVKGWGADFNVLVQWAGALKEGGALDEAEMTYGHALNIRPNDGACHLELGRLMVLQGHADRAQAFYAEALRLDPSLAPAMDELRAVSKGRKDSGPFPARAPRRAEAIDRGTRLTLFRQRMIGNLAFRRN